MNPESFIALCVAVTTLLRHTLKDKAAIYDFINISRRTFYRHRFIWYLHQTAFTAYSQVKQYGMHIAWPVRSILRNRVTGPCRIEIKLS